MKDLFNKIITAFNFTVLGGFSLICYVIVAICSIIAGINIIIFFFRLIF